VFQNDDAADLRDEWRGLLSAGFDPREAGRRLVETYGLSEDADQAPMWLALADLLWRAGRLGPEIRRRALKLIRDGVALDGWAGRSLGARRRALVELAERLRSSMPAPVRRRPSHPCDWKRGELVVWRLVDGGSAVLRVVSFDKRWGGGGSPVVELVGAGRSGHELDLRHLAEGDARRAANSLKLTSGRRWRDTRFKIGVFEAGDYNPRRLRRIKPLSAKRRDARSKSEPIGTRWTGLDGFLLRGYDLPWPRGTILRVPGGASPTWLVVVDMMSGSGLPATVCEVLDWHGSSDPTETPGALDVHRTTDTVSIVRARVVDPRNRKSIAKMKQHLGVQDVDERVPFRVTLLGYAPSSVEVVGRRRVVVPTSASNVVGWDELGTVVNRLVGGDGGT
jgi:hypothetical protein